MRDGPKNYWLAADVARLVNLRDVDRLAFPAIAEMFPGRTKKDCANKYYLEQARRANTASPTIAVRERIRRSGKQIIEALQKPMRLPEHATLTAALFGDPLPGRSALDRQRHDAEPEPARVDYRSAQLRPKPTLAKRLDL